VGTGALAAIRHNECRISKLAGPRWIGLFKRQGSINECGARYVRASGDL
jgi:hypothetical protein